MQWWHFIFLNINYWNKYTKGYLGSLKYLELKIYDLGRGLGSLISGPINELLGMRNTIRLFGITCKYYYLLCDLDTIFFNLYLN